MQHCLQYMQQQQYQYDLLDAASTMYVTLQTKQALQYFDYYELAGIVVMQIA